MTTSSQTDTAEQYEEAADASTRRQLGLRPIAYATNGGKGSHPDQRPSPSWCWVGQSAEQHHEHEVEPRNPMEAHHSMEQSPSLVASLYAAPRHLGGSDYFGTATIETHLEERGQGDPVVVVALRADPEVDPEGYVKPVREIGYQRILPLSLTDAEELATGAAIRRESGGGCLSLDPPMSWVV